MSRAIAYIYTLDKQSFNTAKEKHNLKKIGVHKASRKYFKKGILEPSAKNKVYITLNRSFKNPNELAHFFKATFNTSFISCDIVPKI